MNGIKADDIVYLRARVCSAESVSIAGRECALVEPIDKSGRSVKGAWVFTVPVEWLVPMSEMRRIMESRK